MFVNQEMSIFAQEQKILVISQDDFIKLYLQFLVDMFKEVSYTEFKQDTISAFKKQNYDIILMYCDNINNDVIELIKSVRAICQDKTMIMISDFESREIYDLITYDVYLLSSINLSQDTLIEYLSKRVKCIAMRKNFEIAKIQKVLELSLTQNKATSCNVGDVFDCQIFAIASNILSEISEKKSVVDVNSINFHNKGTTKCVQDFLLSKTSCVEFDSYLYGIRVLTDSYESIIRDLQSNKLNSALLLEFASLYEKFSTMFFLLQDFDKLASVFLNLADLMYLIKAKRYKSSNTQKFTLIIECIYQDIAKFIDLIFVQQVAIDIHYLEDSLQSSIQQIKLNYSLIDNKNNEYDDELELF